METVLAWRAVTMKSSAVTDVAIHNSLRTTWTTSPFSKDKPDFLSLSPEVTLSGTSGPLILPFSFVSGASNSGDVVFSPVTILKSVSLVLLKLSHTDGSVRGIEYVETVLGSTEWGMGFINWQLICQPLFHLLL